MKQSVDYYVVLGCLFMAVWFFGYETARLSYDKECVGFKKSTQPMDKKSIKQWSRYLAARGQG